MQPQHTATVRDAVDGRIPARDHDIDRDSHSSYHHPSRWATPTRRRTDVYVVDLHRPSTSARERAEDEALALTA
jgi:hypothetical protein